MEVTTFLRGDISRGSRIALLLIAIGLLPCLFLPVWEISLQAPQYPNGLHLQIYAHQLAGDLREINLLNHYIGMAEIKPDEFREFIFIPFFILRFLGFAVLAALVARMSLAAVAYIDFALFGAVMMFDFQTWLTRFGNGLAEGAPIRLEPFTPAFFGTTAIGQFQVTSFPGIGGAIMLVAGALGPVLLIYEAVRYRRAMRAG